MSLCCYKTVGVIQLKGRDETLLVAFLIMFREGIEAALIVGIIAGYLKQTGRQGALPAVWIGVVLAVLLCAALGIALDAGGSEFPQKAQELFEGGVALLATGILASMVFWMGRRRARSSHSSTVQSMPQWDLAIAVAWPLPPWRSWQSAAKVSNRCFS
jgi:FTR1 family protein